MEEFEFDLQCLQPTTVFDKPISHFSAYNESGEFKCNYQSPTYNSYQINNPIFNIFCSPNYLKNIFDNENNYRYNNEDFQGNNCREFYSINLPTQKNQNIETFCCDDFLKEPSKLYYEEINTNEKIHVTPKERIIDMLKRKCREILPNTYEIEIFL